MRPAPPPPSPLYIPLLTAQPCSSDLPQGLCISYACSSRDLSTVPSLPSPGPAFPFPWGSLACSLLHFLQFGVPEHKAMDACPCSLSPCWTVSSIHDAFCSVHFPRAASRAHHRGDKEQRERGELVQGPFSRFASWSWEQKGAVGTTVCHV